MPSYARKYSRKGKKYPSRGRKGVSRGGYSTMGSLKYLAGQVWKIKGLINSELYKYTQSYSGNATNSGSVSHLSQIAQGDDEFNRSGNSIYIRSLNFKGYFSRAVAGDAVQKVRFILFIDTQQIGDTAPSVTDVLESANVNAHLSNLTVGRFKILNNMEITLDSVNKLSRNFDINVPMRHHVRYNGPLSTDQQKGAIYALLISTQTTANYPVITSEYRISYHDN
jgi:hypothetical protein